ncbi:hypothetical protein [Nostoc sp. TCL26-01]|uniref:hypothetical protein n=1 Tax=Nostoc sp. TCL26-01 TaxID=2576904 RepID=UPI0015BF0B49|nr:hypothetical protein [Nostoc sp. TCL26-01]
MKLFSGQVLRDIPSAYKYAERLLPLQPINEQVAVMVNSSISRWHLFLLYISL